MKKWLLILLAIFLILPTATAFASTSDGINQFKQSLDKQMLSSNKLYVKNSVNVIDSIQFDGTVTKVLKADDPATKENEEKIDKYQSNLVAVFVEVKEKKDSIFTFSKKALYYYDVTNSEFLLFSNVFENPQVDTFFNKNVSEVGKNFTAGTQIVNLLILSMLFVLAYFIFIFHNENRSTQKITYFDKYSTNN